MKKFSSSTSDVPDLSLLERIFPWTSTGVIKTVNTQYNVPTSVKPESKDKLMQAYIKETVPEKDTKKPDKTNPQKLHDLAKTVNQFSGESTIDQSTPLLEMWNVIESVGIRRDNLDRIFRTDEAAVSELYSLVEKRLHYQREQDMIKRLKAHVEKLVKTKTDSTLTV